MHRIAATLVIGLVLATPLAPAAASAAASARVSAAIVEAVRVRMGDDAVVIVSELEVSSVEDFAFVQAVPAPQARLGRRIQFRLLGANGRGAGARTIGTAAALVQLDVEHVRALALVTRGRELAGDEVEASHGDLTGLPLRRLPRLADVTGARALVNLAPGEVLTRASVTSRPAVRSGQVVRATARVGGVEVVAALVAAQDGESGAVIRVVNKESRRELRARVVDSGVVEVIP